MGKDQNSIPTEQENIKFGTDKEKNFSIYHKEINLINILEDDSELFFIHNGNNLVLNLQIGFFLS